ncbi:hypothetical protein [Ruegeria sp. Ofav3-42]|uniref:hypothetical protein n=1 Tax=Ruegeria sp. Ofav3-42 TaxID=2917759 RepID=UPI001EF67F4B|nr:hypothetical protein [Ruegeria sp. Ofav3-42]MCG7521603.1 hypothetical protein [Ruegeria sp. Ofav3-42]
MSIHMAGSGEEQIIDPAQAEQDDALAKALTQSDLQRRRTGLNTIRQTHRVAEAYNRAVYGIGGHDIDIDPRAVSERQWRCVLKLAATFIRSGGTMTPAQVRHEWAIHMAQEDTLQYLNHDLLVPFEELDARGQLMERAGTEAMRRAMNPPLIIEDYTVLGEEELRRQMHANDDQVAAGELARRRVLSSLEAQARPSDA